MLYSGKTQTLCPFAWRKTLWVMVGVRARVQARLGVGFDTVAPDCGAASESHESVVALPPL